MFKPFYILFSSKYWFDELYENIIVKKLLLGGLFAGLQIFDNNVVDGAVNGLADGVGIGGQSIRRAQTGQLQFYGLFIGIGLLAIIICIYVFG